MGSLWRNGGEYHLVVSFDYDVPEPEWAFWEKSIRVTSKLLHAATNGKAHFASVTFMENGGATQLADVVIYPSRRRRRATGALQGAGRAGYFINLPHARINRPATLLHEFGHYAFGLMDEYVGRAGIGDRGNCLVPIDSSSNEAAACIMERARAGPLLSFPNGPDPAGPLRFFCYGENGENHTVGNLQDAVNGGSCWKTIRTALPDLNLESQPMRAQDAAALKTPPTQIHRRSGGQLVLLALDTSSSAAQLLAPTFRAALDFFVDMLAISGHAVGVVTGPEADAKSESSLVDETRGRWSGEQWIELHWRPPPELPDGRWAGFERITRGFSKGENAEGGTEFSWQGQYEDWAGSPASGGQGLMDRIARGQDALVAPAMETMLKTALDRLDRMEGRSIWPQDRRQSRVLYFFTDGHVQDRAAFCEQVARARRTLTRVVVVSAGHLGVEQRNNLLYLAQETLGSFERGTETFDSRHHSHELLDRCILGVPSYVEDWGLVDGATPHIAFTDWGGASIAVQPNRQMTRLHSGPAPKALGNGRRSATFTTHIEDGAIEAYFVITFAERRGLKVDLRDPKGRRRRSRKDPFRRTGAGHLVLQVPKPENGKWRLTIRSPGGPRTEFSVFVFCRNRRIRTSVHAHAGGNDARQGVVANEKVTMIATERYDVDHLLVLPDPDSHVDETLGGGVPQVVLPTIVASEPIRARVLGPIGPIDLQRIEEDEPSEDPADPGTNENAVLGPGPFPGPPVVGQTVPGDLRQLDAFKASRTQAWFMQPGSYPWIWTFKGGSSGGWRRVRVVHVHAVEPGQTAAICVDDGRSRGPAGK